MNRVLDVFTAGILAAALVVGWLALNSRVIRPYLESRPTSVDNWNELIDGGHVVGPDSARITIVEFIDYECPACRLFEERLQAFKRAHPGSVRMVYRHWPLDRHRSAAEAATGAECAAEQQQFEDFHDFLMASDDWIGDPVTVFRTWAEDGGVADAGKFGECLGTDRHQAKIASDTDLAISIGGRGTPTLVVNGMLLKTMPDSAYFARILDTGRSPTKLSSVVEARRTDTELEVGAAFLRPREPPPERNTRLPRWQVDSVPSLTLGAYSEPVEEIFGYVMGAVEMNDGRVAVVDAGQNAVLFFADDGTFEGSAGQPGEGPSDLMGPRPIPSPSHDSLVVANLHWLSSVSDPGEVEFLSRFPSPRTYVRAVVGTDVVVQELTSMGTRARTTGVRPSTDCFSAWSPASGRQRRLDCVEYTAQYAVVSGQRQRVVSLPFQAGPQIAPLEEAIVMTRPDRPGALTFVELGTGAERVVPVPLEPQRVTRAARRAWVDSAGASESPRSLTVDYSDLPFPEFYPLIAELLPDPAGGFWARLYREHPDLPGATWVAFDESGTLRAQVAPPDDLKLVQVGTSSVLGLRTDSLGVQFVVRHGLDRIE